MEKTLYKVVAEYEIYVENLGFKPKGKIVKGISNDEMKDVFMFSLSHYYKPDANSIDVYMPSRIAGKNFEEVEADLLRYLKGFTTIGVKSNPYY